MSGFHPGQLSFLLWAASDTLPTAVNGVFNLMLSVLV